MARDVQDRTCIPRALENPVSGNATCPLDRRIGTMPDNWNCSKFCFWKSPKEKKWKSVLFWFFFRFLKKKKTLKIEAAAPNLAVDSLAWISIVCRSTQTNIMKPMVFGHSIVLSRVWRREFVDSFGGHFFQQIFEILNFLKKSSEIKKNPKKSKTILKIK